MIKFIPGWISCFRDLMDGFREEKEMKKLYKKPVLYVERFTVDKNFAFACGDDSGEYHFGDMSSCSFINFFLEGNGACEDAIPQDKLEVDCYNGLFNVYNVFAS